MAVQVFRLSNAYVDDKRLSVGSSTLIIPGVARLFRQFTGMSGSVTDSVRALSNQNFDPSVGRSERIDRQDALVGGRSLRAERSDADRLDAPPRTSDRTMGRRGTGSEESDAPDSPTESATNLPAAVADTRLNALIVRDRAHRMESHRSLIESLDQPVDMVQLDAYVIDIKSSRLKEFGLGLSWTGNNALNSALVSPGGAPPVNPNVILQGAQGARVLAQFRALESNGDSELLSVPSVVTLNNLEATFSARENFYVRVAGNQDASLSKVTAETLLKVTPLVSHVRGSPADRRIRLLISVQDGMVDGSTSAVVDTLPRTLENQISTQAVVRGGDTLIIGGQVVRKRIKSKAGLPILNQIPILSELTSSYSEEVSQFVRLYVVRPRILGEDSELAQPTQVNPQTDPTLNPVLNELPRLMNATSLAPTPKAGTTEMVAMPLPPLIAVPEVSPSPPISTAAPAAPTLPEGESGEVNSTPNTPTETSKAKPPVAAMGSSQKLQARLARARDVLALREDAYKRGQGVTRTEVERARSEVRRLEQALRNSKADRDQGRQEKKPTPDKSEP